MKNKTAKDIMTTDVIIANKDDSIVNVAKLLIKEKIGGMPVVDENKKVVGIISETDIMKKEKYVEAPKAINILEGLLFLDNFKQMEQDIKRIAAYKVKDLMSTEIVKVHQDDTFDDVANIMIKKSINRVPVVDHTNTLRGIICRYDIIKAMYNE
ncbi:CBS domain-containing protein [Romboutsia sp.]|uniref:CBS domain-containing protein n=1 Tax=Romboutsia sp. TaxID=1965302 RepID=UPI002C4A29F8|nr:CBS domain-containing protein [Romboutsia sp.]HSQ88602.1 CBS domain-containing protein [Romboutsia sp.]